jgi:predicted hotdog family 3-hydroxylacyl-ACP dehydratase
MEEFNTKESIMQIVPHSGKMSLLDRVVNYDFGKLEIHTEVDITPGSMFFDKDIDGIPVWIGFEYMAQSISALSGLYGKTKGQEPKIGFIMSVNNFTANKSVFPANSTAKIFVRQTMRMDNIVTFDGNITLGDTIVATAVINTIEVDDPKAVLEN